MKSSSGEPEDLVPALINGAELVAGENAARHGRDRSQGLSGSLAWLWPHPAHDLAHLRRHSLAVLFSLAHSWETIDGYEHKPLSLSDLPLGRTAGLLPSLLHSMFYFYFSCSLSVSLEPLGFPVRQTRSSMSSPTFALDDPGWVSHLVRP
jgi:hypothetical protein